MKTMKRGSGASARLRASRAASVSNSKLAVSTPLSRRSRRSARDEMQESTRTAGSSLMSFLSGHRLLQVYGVFREVFIELNRGLTVEEFAHAIAKSLPWRAVAELGESGIALEVLALFAAVDINGDGHLDWEEFVTHIVDHGVSAGVSKLRPPSIAYTFDPSYRDPATRFGAPGILAFGRLDGVFGTGERPNSSMFEGCYLVEERGREIKMLDSRLRVIDTVSIDDALRLRRSTAVVEISSVDYAPEQCLLSVVLTDNSVAMWTWTPKLSAAYLGHIARSKYTPRVVRYAPDIRRLVIGTTEGMLLLYDVASKARVGVVPVSPGSPVQSLLPLRGLESPALLVTSVDRTLHVWDLESDRIRQRLDTGRRLISMTKWHSPSARAFGATSSSRHEVLVWDINAPAPIVTMTGHTRDVANIGFLRVSEADRVLTVDMTCEFRMWDLTDASLGVAKQLMVFAADTLSPTKPIDFAVMAGSRDIIVASKRLVRFAFAASVSSSRPIASLFQPDLMRFYTITGKALSAWDAPTGTKLAEYGNALPVEASAVCWDNRTRQLIVGLADGRVALVDPEAGVAMKFCQLRDGHRGGVTDVAFHAVSCRCVVSTGWDRAIHVYDEQPIHDLILLRRIETATMLGDPCCVATGLATSQIVVGDTMGRVQLFDFETLALQTDLDAFGAATREVSATLQSDISSRNDNVGSGCTSDPIAAEVVFMSFVTDLPLLVVACGGSLQLWSTLGSIHAEPGTLLSCWTHDCEKPAYVLSTQAAALASRASSFAMPAAPQQLQSPHASALASAKTNEDLNPTAAARKAATAAVRRSHPKRMQVRTTAAANAQRTDLVASLPRNKPLGRILAGLTPSQTLRIRKCNASRPPLLDESGRWWEHPSQRRDVGVAKVVTQIVARERALRLGLSTASDSDEPDDTTHSRENSKSADTDEREDGSSTVSNRKEVPATTRWASSNAAGTRPNSRRLRAKGKSSVSALDAGVECRPAAVLYFASKASVESAENRPEARGFEVQMLRTRAVFTSASTAGSGWSNSAQSSDDVHSSRRASDSVAIMANDHACLEPTTQTSGNMLAENHTIPASPPSGVSINRHASFEAEPIRPSSVFCEQSSASSATTGASLHPEMSLRPSTFQMVIGCADGVLLTVDMTPVVNASRETPIPQARRRAAAANYNPLAQQLTSTSVPADGISTVKRKSHAQAPALTTNAVLIARDEVQRADSSPIGSASSTGPERAATHDKHKHHHQQHNEEEDDERHQQQRPPIVCVCAVHGPTVEAATVIGYEDGRVIVACKGGKLAGELDRPAHIDLADSEGTPGMRRCQWRFRVDYALDQHRKREHAIAQVGSLTGSLPLPGNSIRSRSDSTSDLDRPATASADSRLREAIPRDSVFLTEQLPSIMPRETSEMLSTPLRGAERDAMVEFTTRSDSDHDVAPATLPELAVSGSEAMPVHSRVDIASYTTRVLLPRTQEARLRSDVVALTVQERRAVQLPLVSGDDKDTLSLLRASQHLPDGFSSTDNDDEASPLQTPGLHLTALDRVQLDAIAKASPIQAPPRPGKLLAAASTLQRLGTLAAVSNAHASAVSMPSHRKQVASHRLNVTSSTHNNHVQAAVLALNVAASKLSRQAMLGQTRPGTELPRSMPTHMRLLRETPSRMQAAYGNLCDEHTRFETKRPGHARKNLDARQGQQLDGWASQSMSPFLRKHMDQQRPATTGSDRHRHNKTPFLFKSASSSSVPAASIPKTPVTLSPVRSLLHSNSVRERATSQLVSEEVRPMPSATREALIAAARDRSSDPYAVLSTIAPRASVQNDHQVLQAGLDRSLRAREPSVASLLRTRRAAAIAARARISGPSSKDRTGDVDGGADDGAGSEGDAIPARFGPYSTLEVIRARQLFDSIDADGSGSVELGELLTNPDWRNCYTDDRLASMLEAMDQDRSGDVTMQELLSIMFPLANRAMIAKMIRVTTTHRQVHVRQQKDVLIAKDPVTPAQRAEIRAIFAAIDADGDGELNMAEIQRAFLQHASTVTSIFGPTVLQSVVERYDKDDNHGLDLDEFTEFMVEVWLKPRSD